MNMNEIDGYDEYIQIHGFYVFEIFTFLQMLNAVKSSKLAQITCLVEIL